MIPAPTSTSNAPATPTIDPFAPSPTPTGRCAWQLCPDHRHGRAGFAHPLCAGLDGEFVFLGFDSEVFLVKDGPQMVDGYVWWYLVAPYDDARAGWAAL